jgi:hypothetical protein
VILKRKKKVSLLKSLLSSLELMVRNFRCGLQEHVTSSWAHYRKEGVLETGRRSMGVVRIWNLFMESDYMHQEKGTVDEDSCQLILWMSMTLRTIMDGTNTVSFMAIMSILARLNYSALMWSDRWIRDKENENPLKRRPCLRPCNPESELELCTERLRKRDVF